MGGAMTSVPDRPCEIVRLGEDLELDRRLHELRRQGRALKLERIPMELLLLLVEQRDQVVTRQQITERIWGTGHFLDTDNSINSAIRKIRRVLRDHPERPRFVQTVTGRGYRFIAPVVELSKEVDYASPQTGPVAGSARTNHILPRRLFLTVTALIFIAALVTHVERFRPRAHAAPLQRKIMLAVLPFENLTGDASEDYFSDGFTEEMITQLGSVDPHRLLVIARSSVMRYKGHQAPLGRIAHDLAVDYVVEGSIRRSSRRVRITAQLVRTNDRTQVWARDYDRDVRDLLTLQTEIAQEIADQIELTLPAGATHTRSAPSPVLSQKSYQAHDLYLKGRYFWNMRTPQGFERSVQCFQQAIAQDPRSALAYAGLADSYAMMSSYGLVPAERFMPKARAAALRALELDEHLAAAHASLALIAENYDWDWKTAETEYRRAIELNPSYATAHQWYAEFLAFQGRFTEALAESERARQLNPLSLVIAADNGAILYFSRHYDRAIERFRGVLALDPNVVRAHLVIAAYVQEGEFQDALSDITAWRQSDNGPWIWAWKAYVYGRAGDRGKAEQALERLRRLDAAHGVDSARFLALAYAGLNDRDKWLACLEECFRERTNVPTALKVDPIYDPLRREPRFEALLRRVRLAH
jgi:TolB-like protein/DNA-binding winged helix-turn-helix (wHTH) protein